MNEKQIAAVIAEVKEVQEILDRIEAAGETDGMILMTLRALLVSQVAQEAFSAAKHAPPELCLDCQPPPPPPPGCAACGKPVFSAGVRVPLNLPEYPPRPSDGGGSTAGSSPAAVSSCGVEAVCAGLLGHGGLHLDQYWASTLGGRCGAAFRCNMIEDHLGAHSNPVGFGDRRACGVEWVCTRARGHEGLHLDQPYESRLSGRYEPCNERLICNLIVGHQDQAVHALVPTTRTSPAFCSYRTRCAKTKFHEGLHQDEWIGDPSRACGVEFECRERAGHLATGHMGVAPVPLPVCGSEAGCTMPMGHSDAHSNWREYSEGACGFRFQCGSAPHSPGPHSAAR